MEILTGPYTLNDALADFSTKHTLVSPQQQCSEAQLSKVECHHFTEAPISVECEFVETAPTEDVNLRDRKYLWVIEQAAVPFGKECREDVDIKHTNLTGGGMAYCGGEVWFADKGSIYLNGGSGRYPCEDDEILLQNVKGFYMDIGYRVAMPPFDDDVGRRPRVFKSAAMVEWQKRDR
jgi:hypothetical protein